ncbi:MAG: RluA family pseudouridine synthase [Lachnospiraceae bacterium]|nr:RluA family pseudouridine synthase [Lachnospiraceae bacterium]
MSDNAAENEILICDEEHAGLRIDAYLADALDGLTRSYVQRLIKAGLVKASDKAVKPSYKVSDSEEISVSFPEPEPVDILPEDIPLEIFYEDNDIIVVNKPKGMVVHPAAGHISGTLVNALMFHCGSSLSGINGVLRPGIVHRIDKDTTGLLVCCKNDSAHNVMAEKFAAHDITRVYTAICHNHFKDIEGTVDIGIARSKADRKVMAVDPSGKRAVTHYKVIANLGQNMSLIECRLETGRTHQIRVHMSYIKHPILGDTVYGPKKIPISGTEGQTLHAGVLGFEHPITKEYLEFKSPLPEYFSKIITQLQN